MDQSVDAKIGEVLHSGFIGQGPRVDEFEARLRDFLGVPYVVTTNSGTSALHLAYRLAGIERGSKVISTPMTCAATNMPLLERGAKIIWADVDRRSGNIDPSSVDRKISPNTKAIVCVHFGGYPCDMEWLQAIALENDVPIIEDAAHAFGSESRGKIGSHSDFVAFSFQAIKTLTTIDGGALVCKREEDYRRAKLLRWYGMDREDKTRLELRCEADVAEHGYKFHMNDVNATIGIANLASVDDRIRTARENADFYDSEIDRRRLNRVAKTERSLHSRSSFWLYPVLVEDPALFIAFMKSREIHASQVHLRNDVHSCFSAFKVDNLAGLEWWADHNVSIPVGAWVGEEDRAKIIDAITEYDNL